MKTVAAIAILCLGAAAARKPSRETASDRIEKLLAARGGKKSADRRWRRLSGDEECTYYYDDDYCPNCPTQYSAYMTCIDGTYGDDDGDGGDDGDDDGDDDTTTRRR